MSESSTWSRGQSVWKKAQPPSSTSSWKKQPSGKHISSRPQPMVFSKSPFVLSQQQTSTVKQKLTLKNLKRNHDQVKIDDPTNISKKYECTNIYNFSKSGGTVNKHPEFFKIALEGNVDTKTFTNASQNIRKRLDIFKFKKTKGNNAKFPTYKLIDLLALSLSYEDISGQFLKKLDSYLKISPNHEVICFYQPLKYNKSKPTHTGQSITFTFLFEDKKQNGDDFTIQFLVHYNHSEHNNISQSGSLADKINFKIMKGFPSIQNRSRVYQIKFHEKATSQSMEYLTFDLDLKLHENLGFCFITKNTGSLALNSIKAKSGKNRFESTIKSDSCIIDNINKISNIKTKFPRETNKLNMLDFYSDHMSYITDICNIFAINFNNFLESTDKYSYHKLYMNKIKTYVIPAQYSNPNKINYTNIPKNNNNKKFNYELSKGKFIIDSTNTLNIFGIFKENLLDQFYPNLSKNNHVKLPSTNQSNISMASTNQSNISMLRNTYFKAAKNLKADKEINFKNKLTKLDLKKIENLNYDLNNNNKKTFPEILLMLFNKSLPFNFTELNDQYKFLLLKLSYKLAGNNINNKSLEEIKKCLNKNHNLNSINKNLTSEKNLIILNDLVATIKPLSLSKDYYYLNAMIINFIVEENLNLKNFKELSKLRSNQNSFYYLRNLFSNTNNTSNNNSNGWTTAGKQKGGRLTKKILNNMTIKELKNLCKINKIKGYSSLNKDSLILHIKKIDA